MSLRGAICRLQAGDDIFGQFFKQRALIRKVAPLLKNEIRILKMEMMMNFILLFITALFIRPSADNPSHQLFTEILRDYVHEGRVNYRELRNDNRLAVYLEQLAAANPEAIADNNTQLAFWINAYNAYTLKVICDNYPVKSINDLHTGGLIVGTVLKKTIWDKELAIINGKKLTLNQIEHEIIRRRFKEPRIHFALVCAAKSCPPLRSEAFEGERLDEQLDDQGRIFFSQPDKNFFDAEKKVARLSKILDWYEEDFGKNDVEVLQYVSRFLPEKVAVSIQADPKKWKIEYTDYDWSLNE